MARLREFDEDQVIEAVENVFWQKGYEGTSYADLTEATGIGKGSLYAAFGNKHALYLKALGSYIEREITLANQLLTGAGSFSSLNGRERIGQFLNVAIDAISDRHDRRGCFLCNAAVDLAPFDKDVEKIVLKATDKMIEGLKNALNNIGANKDIQARAEYLLSVYLGMRVMAKAGASVQNLENIRESALNTL